MTKGAETGRHYLEARLVRRQVVWRGDDRLLVGEVEAEVEIEVTGACMTLKERPSCMPAPPDKAAREIPPTWSHFQARVRL